MAALPQLETCCCGCTLRTGSLIILWLYLIGGVLYMIGPTIPAGYANPSQNSTSPSGTSASSSMSEMNVAGKYPPMLLVSLGLITTITSGCGLYGVYKEIAVYLVPFLIWELIYVLVSLVSSLIYSFGIASVVGGAIVFLIAFYFWLVVFGHYRVIKGSVRGTQA